MVLSLLDFFLLVMPAGQHVKIMPAPKMRTTTLIQVVLTEMVINILAALLLMLCWPVHLFTVLAERERHDANKKKNSKLAESVQDRREERHGSPIKLWGHIGR